MSKNSGLFFILIIVISVSSCKSKEKIARTNADREMDMLILKNNIEKERSNIETLKFNRVKMKLKFNGEEYKLGGTIGLIRDSIIVLSIVPIMGYEMARVYCTKDSIVVINRTEKSYYKSLLKDEMRKFNISADYDILQSVLMNKYFIYTESTKDRFFENSLVSHGGDYLIKTEEKISDKMYFEQEQVVDANHYGIKSILINDYLKKETIRVEYDLFQNYEEVSLPGRIVLNSEIMDDILSVEIRIGDIVVNEELNAAVKIPSKYNRLTL